ncbi:MAG: 16S rRNA (guanine(527)-N(7))-methyltransferase RsmG [Clostridia bacterium]|nr:16S rRNA (guanine(527)-N(7))-methyltransferase RsmG [Clostridia bacterium]
MNADTTHMLDELTLLLPELSPAQRAQFARYYELLTEHNARVNLTAIVDPVEVARKHFADSVAPAALIPRGSACIDVGTGAGFPGVALKIARPDISLTLLDSLAKRVSFLTALLEELRIGARCIHARAEDAGRDPALRERFDAVLSRAVAPANVLLELTIPFARTQGCSIMYKGAQAQEELDAAQGAAQKLHCALTLENYAAAWGTRSCIVARKLRPTASAYPRKPAAIRNKPL